VGVSRAGTTSLFEALARHPDVFGSSPKETRYFQPIRYGEPLPPLVEYSKFFRGYAGQLVSMEATPDYVYGGEPTARVIGETCRPRVAIILRNPAERLVSFFEFMKVRRQLPAAMTLDAYLDACLDLPPGTADRREHNAYTGLSGGEYARFLPAWLDRYAEDCHLLYYDDLRTEPSHVLRELHRILDIDPDAEADIQQLNSSQPSRSHALYVAAAALARYGRPLRQRFPGLEPRARRLYERVNQGGSTASAQPAPAAALSRANDYYQSWNQLLIGELTTRSLPTDRIARWAVSGTPTT
jgi:Sulfotransferase domain